MLLIFFRFILKWRKVEDSGGLGIYTDGVVMSNSGQTSYHKTFKPSNLTNPGRLYPQTSHLSTLKPYTKWQKMSNKLMKRFDNILESREKYKPFVMSFILWGLVYFLIPRSAMSNSIMIHGRAGDK